MSTVEALVNITVADVAGELVTKLVLPANAEMPQLAMAVAHTLEDRVDGRMEMTLTYEGKELDLSACRGSCEGRWFHFLHSWFVFTLLTGGLLLFCLIPAKMNHPDWNNQKLADVGIRPGQDVEVIILLSHGRDSKKRRQRRKDKERQTRQGVREGSSSQKGKLNPQGKTTWSVRGCLLRPTETAPQRVYDQFLSLESTEVSAVRDNSVTEEIQSSLELIDLDKSEIQPAGSVSHANRRRKSISVRPEEFARNFTCTPVSEVNTDGPVILSHNRKAAISEHAKGHTRAPCIAIGIDQGDRLELDAIAIYN